MKREDLVSQTRRLIDEGDRIDRSPSRAADEKSGLPDHLHEAPHGLVGGASALQAAIDAARKEAAAHEDHALNRKSTPQKSDRTDLW